MGQQGAQGDTLMVARQRAITALSLFERISNSQNQPQSKPVSSSALSELEAALWHSRTKVEGRSGIAIDMDFCIVILKRKVVL